MGRFEIHGYTPEHVVAGESTTIATLLDSNAIDIMHLRHPHTEEHMVESILKEIPSRLHHRLSIHDHHDIACRYGCAIHLTSRNPHRPAGFDGTISTSCHTIDEIRSARHTKACYVTLSPIFDSISKHGYPARFHPDSPDLRAALKNHKVIALGGVTPDRFQVLADAGFAGAAMLGFLPFHDTSKLTIVIDEILRHRAICCNS